MKIKSFIDFITILSLINIEFFILRRREKFHPAAQQGGIHSIQYSFVFSSVYLTGALHTREEFYLKVDKFSTAIILLPKYHRQIAYSLSQDKKASD